MKNLFFIAGICSLFISCSENSEKSKPKKKENTEANTDSTETNNTSSPVSLPDGEYYYSGAIAHIYPFHMHIEIKENSITGAYYYHSQKKEINLTGSIIDGKLELDEMYKEKITGHFISDVLTPDSISGEWKSPKGKKFDFALTLSDEDEYLYNLGKQKQTWSTEEFLNFTGKFQTTVIPFDYIPVTEYDENLLFDQSDVRKFINPGYDFEEDFEYRYYYGIKYETEKYIALIYTESYFPGVFGIDNHNAIVRTFTKDGQPIDEDYAGCVCFDNNYYDYYSTDEKLTFTGDKIIVTGYQNYASHEWAEEEGMPVFDDTEEINREIKITSDGRIGN